MIAGLYKIFDHWSQKGAVWIYSDPHFNDKEIIAGVENHPSDDEQVKSINAKVGKYDTIIFLGDICDVEYVRKIRGYKVLICGNHDAGVSNYKRQIIGKCFDSDKWKKEEAIAQMKKSYPNWHISCDKEYDMLHSPFDYWYIQADNKLFDEVYEGPLMISEKIILSHEPIDVPWAFNIHGHVHDKKAKDKPNQLNVCADVIDYTPVSLIQLVKNGIAANVCSIHRETIDRATKNSRKKKESK